jgi:hypothetical protein
VAKRDEFDPYKKEDIEWTVWQTDPKLVEIEPSLRLVFDQKSV